MTIYRNLILSSIPILLYAYYRNRSKKMISSEFFNNKQIIITGASQGIGKELANTLSKYNTQLFLLARSLKTHKDNNIHYFNCDCSKYEDVTGVFKSIYKSHKPDILIHCAGGGDWKFITEMSTKEIIDCIKAPLLASIFTTKKFIDNINLDNNRDDNPYQVLFVQSPASIQPWKSSTAYATSRIAMHGFTEALRADYHDKDISFKEIILGKVDSTYFSNNPNAKNRFPFISKIIPNMTVGDAASVIIDAIKNKSSVYVHPPIISVLRIINQFCPFVIRNLVYRLGYDN